MVSIDTEILGKGIYTPVEAARFARVRTELITRWIHGSRQGDPVVKAELEGDAERTITFRDFVQALAIRAIKREFGLSLQNIRDAVDAARERYGCPCPFAMEHKTYLFGQKIFIELPGRLSLSGPSELVQISRRGRGQMLLREVAEPFLVDLTFAADGYATRYVAWRPGNREVVMDPSRLFGQPVIESCGHTVGSLVDAYRSEGSTEAAARAFGVMEEDVFLAIGYDDYLTGPVAA